MPELEAALTLRPPRCGNRTLRAADGTHNCLIGQSIITDSGYFCPDVTATFPDATPVVDLLGRS
jgi:hypothetical protein